MIITPEFEIDKNGITICKSHNMYDSNSLNIPTKIKSINSIRVHLLSGLYKFCNTCEYYLNNQCFFSRAEINKVYRRRGLLFGQFFNRHKCDICGHQIINVLIVLKKKFYEEKTKKKSFSICTSCQLDIINGNLRSKMRSYKIYSLLLMLLIDGMGIPIIIRSFLISTNFDQLMWSAAFAAMIITFTLIWAKRSSKYFSYKKKIFIPENLINDKKIKKKLKFRIF